MSVRIRKDGTIVCAAMHPEMPDDTYINDGLQYRLSVQYGVLVTDDEHNNGHGLWWWFDAVPPEKNKPDDSNLNFRKERRQKMLQPEIK